MYVSEPHLICTCGPFNLMGEAFLLEVVVVVVVDAPLLNIYENKSLKRISTNVWVCLANVISEKTTKRGMPL